MLLYLILIFTTTFFRISIAILKDKKDNKKKVYIWL